MKKSIFKQSFTVKGDVKTATGEIIVTMNYETLTLNRRNPILDEDFNIVKSLHKIESFVEGRLWDSRVKLDSEDRVIIEVSQMKKDLQNHLKKISNLKPKKSFVEKLQELGF